MTIQTNHQSLVNANFTNGLAAVALPQPYNPDEEIKVLHYKL